VREDANLDHVGATARSKARSGASGGTRSRVIRKLTRPAAYRGSRRGSITLDRRLVVWHHGDERSPYAMVGARVGPYGIHVAVDSNVDDGTISRTHRYGRGDPRSVARAHGR